MSEHDDLMQRANELRKLTNASLLGELWAVRKERDALREMARDWVRREDESGLPEPIDEHILNATQIVRRIAKETPDA